MSATIVADAPIVTEKCIDRSEKSEQTDPGQRGPDLFACQIGAGRGSVFWKEVFAGFFGRVLTKPSDRVMMKKRVGSAVRGKDDALFLEAERMKWFF